MSHPHLLSEGNIGSLRLRNRILMCPMGDNQATGGGYVTDQQVAYFEARAQGGAALLLVGSVGVTAPDGLSSPRQSAIGDDSFVPGWSRLSERVHAHGAKLALQLVHNGKNAVEDIIAARPLLVPSSPEVPLSADPLMGMLTPDEASRMGTPAQVEGARVAFHEMTHADIARIVGAHADAVARARAAGVDAVELHAGHGYLIDNFLSPTTNHRRDEYGGSVDNRARFLIEILRAIRDRVGDDYPVWCRINGEEYLIDGETLEDAIRVAQLAEEAGADALHVSAYADPSRGIGFTEAHATHTPGRFLPLAAAIKARVSIPIIAVGRLTPDAAEAAIAEGKADFVAMGRKLLADPELPNRLAEGRPESIRPCMYHYRCISQIFVRASVKCAVNAETGFESQRTFRAAPRAKNVLVVGGGPAGMETARLAALRGHSVTLIEATERLGGRFALAARTAEPNAELLGWLESELSRAKVDVRMGRRFEPDEFEELERFEEIVVATGAQWPRPAIPGASAECVATVDELADWLSISAEAAIGTEVGTRFVLIGGDRAGLALAGVARARGASVEVLEPTSVFAASIGLVGRWRHVHEAREGGIVLQPNAQALAIESDGVVWRDEAGRERRAAADRVIVSGGAQPDLALAERLEARGLRVHPVGDCAAIGLIEGAMHGAAELASAL